MKSTASAKHRIFQALFATVILVTAVFAVPSTNAKYTNSKTYTINISSVVRELQLLYDHDTKKDIAFSEGSFSRDSNWNNIYVTTTAGIQANANTTNSNSGKVYYFVTHDASSGENAKRYRIDGVNLYSSSYTTETLDGASSRHWKGQKIVNYLENTLGATNLTPIGVYPYTYNLLFNGSRYNNTNPFILTVTEDLKEGWYYTQMPFYVTSFSKNTMYVFSLFYLPAAQDETMNPERIAIHATPSEPKTITFNFDRDAIQLLFSSYVEVISISFPQAYYAYK